MPKPGYRKTEIGEIPEEWKVVRLKEILVLIRNGLTLPQNKNGKGVPISRIETISEEKIDPNKVGFVEGVDSEIIEGYKLMNGDILFSHINSITHIGKTAIYENKPNLLLHGMNLLLLRPDISKVNPYFLLYTLKRYRLKGIFKNMSKKAVNQASINQTELQNLKIPLPPLPEQKRIAKVLSTVDESIEKTEREIEHTERLKKGLMQRLLMSGIGHTEFKETEIGRIPKGWAVVGLGDERVSKIIKSGSTPSKKVDKYWNGNIPFVTQSDMTKVSKYISDTSNKITEFALHESRLLLVPSKSLLLSMYGTIGKVVITKVPLTVSQNIAAIVPNENNICEEFLYYVIQQNEYQFGKNAKTITLRHLDNKIVKNFKLPLPPLPEQREIAEILGDVDKKLELLRGRKERLEKVKKGLMNDLLTGRKRVPEGVV